MRDTSLATLTDERSAFSAWPLDRREFAPDSAAILNSLRIRLVQLGEHFPPRLLAAVSKLGCGFCSRLLQHPERITCPNMHAQIFP